MNAPSANEMYRAAQTLVRSGQPVFPCKVYGKKAKAPFIRNGLLAASLDRAQVKSWWSEHRGAAIGIPTGIIWDVLDVDQKGAVDGRVHLRGLQDLGLLNGCQRVAQTPSGGWHLYFRAAHGLTNKASATLGLDVRAKGGYVLAPPSWIDTPDYTGPYVDHGDTTNATDEPLLWDLIVNNIIPVNRDTKKPIKDLLPSERRASLASLREWVSIREAGERNNALHWAVCRCIENNLDPNELMEPALLSGLSEDEVSLTINAALRRAGLTAEELDSEAEALFPDEPVEQQIHVQQVAEESDPRAEAMFPDE